MKKYLLISEVAELLNLSQARLRYLEKASDFKIHKIRGRRYYSARDIEKIKKFSNIQIQNIQAREATESLSHKDSISSVVNEKAKKPRVNSMQLDFFTTSQKIPINGEKVKSNLKVDELNVLIVRLQLCQKNLSAILLK